jgi:putative transposase
VLVDYLDEHKGRFGVEPVCAVLKDAGVQIAPSSYYAAKTRAPSARSLSDASTTALIERVHADNFGVYGVRKVHAELRRQGHRVARCTVQRLMRAAELRGISRGKGPRTTVPGSTPDTRPDLVDHTFTATAPNQVWVADIVRHEAPWIRVEVRDLHRRVVAAARLELRAV